MNRFKVIWPFFFIIFYSCSEFGTTTDTYYYKCFFLGDISFIMDGEIFDIIDKTNTTSNPHESKYFNNFVVKTTVEGWKITGTKTSGSKYELTINTFAGNTINKETIKPSFLSFGFGYQFNDIFPVNFPICKLLFSVDDHDLSPHYQEPRTWDPQRYYKYDYLEYGYVYVAETITISITKEYIYENNVWGGDSKYIHHFDLDFTRPGWYKVIKFDNIYNKNNFINNAKHKTGQNTNFYL